MDSSQETARVACCPLPLHSEEPTALYETQPKQPNLPAPSPSPEKLPVARVAGGTKVPHLRSLAH